MNIKIPEGFTRWGGGANPAPGKMVNVAMRPLSFESDNAAVMSKRYCSDDIKGWKHSGNAGDIIAYRIVS